jgi:hypothetical protein
LLVRYQLTHRFSSDLSLSCCNLVRIKSKLALRSSASIESLICLHKTPRRQSTHSPRGGTRRTRHEPFPGIHRHETSPARRVSSSKLSSSSRRHIVAVTVCCCIQSGPSLGTRRSALTSATRGGYPVRACGRAFGGTGGFESTESCAEQTELRGVNQPSRAASRLLRASEWRATLIAACDPIARRWSLCRSAVERRRCQRRRRVPAGVDANDAIFLAASLNRVICQ